MQQTAKEKVLEKIISKLKENVTQSEELLKSEAMDPVGKKIDSVIQNLHSLMGKNAIDQDTKGSLSLILNGLENIRDNYTYFKNMYNTYVFVLDAMYNEYNSGSSSIASEPPKIMKEARIEREMPSHEPQVQPQAKPRPREPAVVIRKIVEEGPRKIVEEEPKEKVGRFKFQF